MCDKFMAEDGNHENLAAVCNVGNNMLVMDAADAKTLSNETPQHRSYCT